MPRNGNPDSPIAPPRPQTAPLVPDRLLRQPALLGVAVLFGLLVRFAAGVLPPAIGGSLLGVFLSGLAHAIQRRTPLADRQAYTLPLLAGLLLFIPAAWRLAPA